MAAESKENQFKWFVKLNETQGPEAANKYVEVLNQMPSVMAKPMVGLNSTAQNVDLIYDNLVNKHSGNAFYWFSLSNYVTL